MEIKRRVVTPGANPSVLRGAFLLHYFLGNIETCTSAYFLSK
jgi:hypothetical protein